MNPLRQLLLRGSSYTFATALQLSGALLVLPAITRLLPPDEYGVVALAIIVQQLLGWVGGLGLGGVITRDYFRPERGPEVSRQLVCVTLFGATLVALMRAVPPAWADMGACQRV